MASEAAPDSLGPRYAPEDPTLPKPWLGLIDGSSGVQYYWNPETNVTQYERPASLAPPLPSVAPPSASTPALAPIPGARTAKPDGAVAPQGQQMGHQQGQQMNQYPQQMMTEQQGQFAPQSSNHPGSQLGQPMLHQIRQQMMQQHGGQQMAQQPSQQPAQHPGHQMAQHSIHQMPPQQGQQMPQHQGSQVARQFPQQQYMAYQQSMPPQGHQSSIQQQSQHSVQDQSFLHKQDSGDGFQKHAEVDFQQRNPIGFQPSQFQQNVPNGSNLMHVPQMGGRSAHGQHFGAPPVNMQQSTSGVKMQLSGTDNFHHQHAPMLQNQSGVGPMHGSQTQSNIPPVGRGGNEYYYGSGVEGPMIGAQQPKLAMPASARNQQEIRTGGATFQNVTPVHTGGMNSGAGPTIHNGPPFSNNTSIRSPLVGPSGVSHISPVEVYRQQHEVSTMGENVPAPYMTFEETGFPSEILRDVRYLLHWGSICRTLHIYGALAHSTTILTFGSCK